MSAEKMPAPAEAPATAAPAAAAAPETPLSKLTARLSNITSKAEHAEMWGVELSPSGGHAPTQVVLLKFLRANSFDVEAAAKQLTSALEWRKRVQPTRLVSEAFDRKKFAELGYVTTHRDGAGKETVITWNIYGAVKDNKATFGNVDEFIRWRTALMELGVQKLRLNDITEPLAQDDEDVYRMLQVHDYLSVSFFRMDPAVKAASKQTIQTLSMAYPELLAHKYFVNVPAIMGWMFGFMKLFLAPATLRKFHPMKSGTTLATELKGIAGSLPKEYGGQGPSVKEAETVQLVDDGEVEVEGVQAGDKEDGGAAAAAEEPTKPDAQQSEAKPAEAVTGEVKAADGGGVAAAPVVAEGEAKPVAEAEGLAKEATA